MRKDEKITDDQIVQEIEYYEKKFQNDRFEVTHMSDLFERERNLQRKLYGASWSWDIDTTIKDYAMHLHHEVCEMEKEVNFKLQTKRKKEINMSALQSEVVDVFIFALASATATFKTYDEFIQAVKSKIEYNESRNDWDANK